MCEPTTSYPCSLSRQAATDESTPPDIATSTDPLDVIDRGYQRGWGGLEGSLRSRGYSIACAVREPLDPRRGL